MMIIGGKSILKSTGEEAVRKAIELVDEVGIETYNNR